LGCRLVAGGCTLLAPDCKLPTFKQFGYKRERNPRAGRIPALQRKRERSGMFGDVIGEVVSYFWS
jgi:hypothetical protein